MAIQITILSRTVKHKQQGVVLVIALVFLIALTAVAAALMQNSTSDMKMSGASEEKVIALQDAISAVDEVIATQKQTGFTRPVSDGNFPIADALPEIPSTQASANVELSGNPFLLERNCPRSKVASSTGVFQCRLFTVNVSRAYGRTGASTINVRAGVTQQIINTH